MFKIIYIIEIRLLFSLNLIKNHMCTKVGKKYQYDFLKTFSTIDLFKKYKEHKPNIRASGSWLFNVRIMNKSIYTIYLFNTNEMLQPITRILLI